MRLVPLLIILVAALPTAPAAVPAAVAAYDGFDLDTVGLTWQATPSRFPPYGAGEYEVRDSALWLGTTGTGAKSIHVGRPIAGAEAALGVAVEAEVVVHARSHFMVYLYDANGTVVEGTAGLEIAPWGYCLCQRNGIERTAGASFAPGTPFFLKLVHNSTGLHGVIRNLATNATWEASAPHGSLTPGEANEFGVQAWSASGEARGTYEVRWVAFGPHS